VSGVRVRRAIHPITPSISAFSPSTARLAEATGDWRVRPITTLASAGSLLPSSIRAAVFHDVHSAHQCVEHDDVNIMCIGAQIVGPWLANDLISSYLSAEFSTDENFRRWVEKLRVMDEEG
jgi:ribose 5-phosphate isomerase B